MVLGLLLALAVSLQSHTFVIFLGATFWIIVAPLYDLEPIRLKRRGLWGPAMIALYLGFLPGFILPGLIAASLHL